MERPKSQGSDASPTSPSRPPGPSRKRSASGAGGLLSKLTFMRSSGDRPKSRHSIDENEVPQQQAAPSSSLSPPLPDFAPASPGSLASALEQQKSDQKTRRRRGSLRKVALLGRGVQREKSRNVTIDTRTEPAIIPFIVGGASERLHPTASPIEMDDDAANSPTGDDTYGLGISDITPRPSMDGYASRSVTVVSPGAEARDTKGTTPTTPTVSIPMSGFSHGGGDADSIMTSPSMSYSTTDDEDALQIGRSHHATMPPSLILHQEAAGSLSSGSESYFPQPNRPGAPSSSSSVLPSIQRRRSLQRAKSPLAINALTGLSTTPIASVSEADWDYSETEWWGWVVLVVTWAVFVTGMGSCLGVWSWAWDVGTTPYAPPELEDDPTLPIVGYYPALLILTCVMAWVWVVVAWIGMKYFRHARVSGD